MKIMTDPNKINSLEDLKTATGAVDQYGWFSKAIQYDQIYQDTQAAQQEDHGNNYNFNRNRNLRQSVQKGNEQSWRQTKTTLY